MFVANYGVRTYQVSDLDEEHSFSDYQINRVDHLRRHGGGRRGVLHRCAATPDQMLAISMGVYAVQDGGRRWPTCTKGACSRWTSCTWPASPRRSARCACFVVFSLVLFVHPQPARRRASPWPWPRAPRLRGAHVPLGAVRDAEVAPGAPARGVAVGCSSSASPCFVALFMYSLIDNMPKFVMEGVLSYDNQLYFNALYFPAQMHPADYRASIYKPLLVRMAEAWADPEKRRRFDLIIVVIMFVIVAHAPLWWPWSWAGSAFPVMSFLYGLDFEPFRGLCFIMLAAGGVTAAIDFLYQVITVLRRQQAVMRLYLITFGFSLFVPMLLVNFTGLPGAVIGYLIVMCILLVLLVFGVHRASGWSFARQDKLRPRNSAARLRPSEVRAERERREKVHAKWESGAHARRGAGAQDNQDDRDERQLPA